MEIALGSPSYTIPEVYQIYYIVVAIVYALAFVLFFVITVVIIRK